MNFKGILSKSSLKSSSSGKSSTRSQEVLKLHSEIESLKETIDSLKISMESRDSAIGTLAREKENIYIELKVAQRTNRNLHQQLVDERDIHSKEKEFLINEINRLSKRSEREIKTQPDDEYVYEDQYKIVFDQLKAKDEVIFNIGAKYMKIKASKMSLQKKLQKLRFLNQKTCEKIFFLLRDNRKTLNNLLDNLIKSSTLSPNSKQYLTLLQINADLHYENTQLKIHLSTKHSIEILHKEFINGQEYSKGALSISKYKEHKNSCLKVSDICNPMTRSKFKYAIDQECLDHRSYKYMHKTISSFNFRNEIYRSASDTCIIRRNLNNNIINRN